MVVTVSSTSSADSITELSKTRRALTSLDTDSFVISFPKRASSRSISLTSLRTVSSESLWDRAMR
jgi:hypothetical protein